MLSKLMAVDQVVVFDEDDVGELLRALQPDVHCKGTDYAAFFSTQTVNKPKVYDKDTATANARLSSWSSPLRTGRKSTV